jgi:transcriptional regulator with XRE-family HTH domain
MDYDFPKDIQTIKGILSLTSEQLASAVNVSPLTLSRWEKGEQSPSPQQADALYSFAYSNPAHGIALNLLKAQLRQDDRGSALLLFHGSESGIQGEIDTHHTRGVVDFGPAFYAGESYVQAASWVAGRENSSVYTLYFQPLKEWKYHVFSVDLEWLLAVAYFRHKIPAGNSSPLLQKILSTIQGCDYLLAPIADNTMYETIANFMAGFITSEQCLHSLSANSLGNQVVFLKDSICHSLVLQDRLFLARKEREDLLSKREKTKKEGLDKVKLSLLEYRGKGLYIGDLLNAKTL